MIFRRYGTSFQSVDLNFDSKALNEIGFRRNHEQSIAADEFEAGYEKVGMHELVAEAEGNVQDETEAVLLQRLEQKVNGLLGVLSDGELLLVENEQGHDYPKTKQKTSNVIIEGENKLHFVYTMAPPLRVSVYRPKA